MASKRTDIDQQGKGISGKSGRRRRMAMACASAAFVLGGLLLAPQIPRAQTAVTVDPDALEGLGTPTAASRGSAITLRPPGSPPASPANQASPPASPPANPSPTQPRVVEAPAKEPARPEPPPVPATVAIPSPTPVPSPAPTPSSVIVDNDALKQLPQSPPAPAPSPAVTLRRPGEVRPDPEPAPTPPPALALPPQPATAVTVDTDALGGIGADRSSTSGATVTLRRPGDPRPEPAAPVPAAPRNRGESVAVDAAALDALGPAPRSGGIALRAPRAAPVADSSTVAIDAGALDSLGGPPPVAAVSLRPPRADSLFETPKSSGGARVPAPNRQSTAALRLASVNSAARTGVTVDASALERLDSADGGGAAPVTLRPPPGAAAPQRAPAAQVAAIVPPRPSLTPIPTPAPPRPAPEAAPVPAPIAAPVLPPRPTITPPPTPQAAPASLPPQQPATRPAITSPEPPVPHVPGASTVLFDKGSSELPGAAPAELDVLVGRVRSGNGRLEIRGFANATDNQASEARRLSLARAVTVRTYLAAHGLDLGRMDVRALGVQANDPSPADRVEIVLRDR